MLNKFNLFVDKIGRLSCNVEDEIEYIKKHGHLTTTIFSPELYS